MKETIMTKISDEEFKVIVAESSSVREIATKCGYSNNSGASSSIVKNRIENLGLSTDHFGSHKNIIRTDAEIFIEDSPVYQATLRRRYLAGNYSEYKCAICGLEPIWNSQPLTLTLDHINGHNKDDRLENLRWICPNCDRQLETFAGKNIARTEQEKNHCIDCGAEILQSSTRCAACAAKVKGIERRKADRPDREVIKALIRSTSFTAIGAKFGVTDNAIRKWCDAYNLPRTKKAIQQYSDEEWANL